MSLLLTPREVDWALLSTDSVIVDIRTPESRSQSGMVVGSTILPLYLLSPSICRSHALEADLDPQSGIIVVAEDTAQGLEAVSAFRRAGFRRVAVLAGGFPAWAAEMPVPDADLSRFEIGA